MSHFLANRRCGRRARFVASEQSPVDESRETDSSETNVGATGVRVCRRLAETRWANVNEKRERFPFVRARFGNRPEDLRADGFVGFTCGGTARERLCVGGGVEKNPAILTFREVF